MKNNKGVFIAFEGIDGCGKSTQIKLLAENLRKMNLNCYETFEPTDGEIGKLIRKYLSYENGDYEKIIASLFVSDRLDHLLNLETGILKKLDENINVLTDRYYFSSYAYQSFNIPMDYIINSNSLSSDMLKPDLTVFIDISPETAMKRIESRNLKKEVFENLNRLKNVRGNYLEAFDKFKDVENIVIIDGEGDISDISEKIFLAVKSLF